MREERARNCRNVRWRGRLFRCRDFKSVVEISRSRDSFAARVIRRGIYLTVVLRSKRHTPRNKARNVRLILFSARSLNVPSAPISLVVLGTRTLGHPLFLAREREPGRKNLETIYFT